MQTQSEKMLATERIPKLIWKLALPSVVAQLINLLYNMVDRMYIGHIPGEGALALTGLGVCLPVILIISAFSAFVGMGGAPLASIALGQGNRERAERILGSGTVLLTCLSVVLTAGIMVFKEPILWWFGASENTIAYADQYLTIYLFGTIFVQFALGLNTYISQQGQAKTAMLSVLIGAVANIVLDPIFIFALGMGVRGAALATILSQALSALWVVGFLAGSRSAIRIRRRYLRFDWKILGSVAALGVSPFIMQTTESAILIVFNKQLGAYGGDMYVASMTILQSVMQLTFVSIQGFTQGVAPIVSYNYGAKRLDRVRAAYRIMALITCTLSALFWALGTFFPEMFARMFSPDDQLIALVKQVLPIYMGGMWLFGIQMSSQMMFMSLGKSGLSLVVALLRKVILLIPLAFALPLSLGVNGVYWAEPISDVISATASGILFAAMYRKTLKESPARTAS